MNHHSQNFKPGLIGHFLARAHGYDPNGINTATEKINTRRRKEEKKRIELENAPPKIRATNFELEEGYDPGYAVGMQRPSIAETIRRESVATIKMPKPKTKSEIKLEVLNRGRKLRPALNTPLNQIKEDGTSRRYRSDEFPSKDNRNPFSLR